MNIKTEHDYNSEVFDSLLAQITPESQRISDYRAKLAVKILKGMQAMRWNRTEFARQMEKENSVITKWLSGKHNFSGDTLFEIQQKLNINLLNLEEENISSEIKGSIKKFSLKGCSTSLPPIDETGGKVAGHWYAEETLLKK